MKKAMKVSKKKTGGAAAKKTAAKGKKSGGGSPKVSIAKKDISKLKF